MGPLSAHMAQHIVLMNLVAPLAAIILNQQIGRCHRSSLVPATALQLLLLWGWHTPSVLVPVTESPTLHLVMQASLLGSAVWFWMAIVRVAGSAGWRPIVALLVTSKLFCLLGAILAFSPRPLYALAASHHLPRADALTDQQLAGLLMLVACPATYILGAIIMASRWFGALERDAVGRGAGSG